MELSDIHDNVLALAPSCLSLAEVGRQANAQLGLDWSEGGWRGVWKKFPEFKLEVQQHLGRTYYDAGGHNGVLYVEGDVRGAIISDVHSPFHDPRAVELATKVLERYQPDTLVFNGDMLDCYHLSRFDQNPARRHNLQYEIDALHREVVGPMRAAVASSVSNVYWLLGNHEDRLRRLLWNNTGLFGLRALEWPNLLGLPERNIIFTERSVRFSNLLEVTHGEFVRKHSGYTAKAELEERAFQISVASGHVHRSGRYERWTMNGLRVAQEVPCLMDLSPEYKFEPNNVHGLGLFSIRGSDLFLGVVVFTTDYSCFFNGEWISI